MSPSTDPVELNRQTAVDLLDQLDRLAQSVDGRTISSQRVFDLAAKVVEQSCGFTPTISLHTDTGDRSLVESTTSVEPTKDGDRARTPLSSVPLAATQFISLHSRNAKEPPGADWQKAFLESVAECCSVAFLKQFYADSTSASSGIRNGESSTRMRTFAITTIGLVVLVLVGLLPVQFRLPTEGTIQPAINIGVFAPTSGELTEITVIDGTHVTQGQVLAKIGNPELRLQAERLRGDLLAAQADLVSTRLYSSDQNSRRGANRSQVGTSSSKVAVLRTRIASLQRQVSLIEEVLDSLVIRARQSGRVVIDDQQSKSVGQAVMPSQQIMRLGDNRSGYRAIIRIPAESYGYLNMDGRLSGEAPHASLRLRADPRRRFEGPVTRVGDTVQLDERGRSVIDLFVDLQNLGGKDVRFDAPLVGQVYLGRRPLGFVMFRPLIEFIREHCW